MYHLRCMHVQIFEKVHLWWGYSRMHANATHMRIEAITNLDGSVIDTLTLQKPQGWGKQWHDKHGPPQLGPGSPNMVRCDHNWIASYLD